MRFPVFSLQSRALRLPPASSLPVRFRSTFLKHAAGVLVFLLLPSACPAARADSFSVYTVSGGGLVAGNQSLSGTFRIDTTTDEIESGDLNAGGVPLTVLQDQFDSSQSDSGLLGPESAAFDLIHNNLVVNTGSDIFIGATTLTGSKTGADSATPAPTPEPSSLLLLCTGLVAIAGALRKKSPGRGGSLTALARAAAAACSQRLQNDPARSAGPRQEVAGG